MRCYLQLAFNGVESIVAQRWYCHSRLVCLQPPDPPVEADPLHVVPDYCNDQLEILELRAASNATEFANSNKHWCIKNESECI